MNSGDESSSEYFVLRTNQSGLGQTVQVRKAWSGRHHCLKGEGGREAYAY